MERVVNHRRDLDMIQESMRYNRIEPAMAGIEYMVLRNSDTQDLPDRRRSVFADVLDTAYTANSKFFIEVLETLGVEDLVDFNYGERWTPHRVHRLSDEQQKIYERLKKITPVFPVRQRQVLL
jgi:hypothetical protein